MKELNAKLKKYEDEEMTFREYQIKKKELEDLQRKLA
jgi:chromosome segregation ATPase